MADGVSGTGGDNIFSLWAKSQIDRNSGISGDARDDQEAAAAMGGFDPMQILSFLAQMFMQIIGSMSG